MMSRTLCVMLLACAVVSPAMPRGQSPQSPTITVYKSATCGCCSKWVEHMRAAGFEAKVLDVDDTQVVKKTYGVPSRLASCHTALVGTYVIEGHVPADAIKRALRERPAIAGLAVPGMPAGSPGMEVAGRRDPYSIVSFDKAGKQEVYEQR